MWNQGYPINEIAQKLNASKVSVALIAMDLEMGWKDWAKGWWVVREEEKWLVERKCAKKILSYLVNLDNFSTSSGEIFLTLYEMTALFENTLYFSADSPGGIRKVILISLNG